MKWDKKYGVGIDEIDSQHKRLFEMVNEFYSTSGHGEPEKAIKRLLVDLFDYVITHFRFEERYLDQFEYEHSAVHKNEHQELTDRISELIERVNAGKSILTLEVSNFMKDWLLNHTYTSDQKYRECFKKNWPARIKQPG